MIVILPKYAFIDYQKFGLQPFLSPLGVWMGSAQEWAAVHLADNGGVPVYFIESHKYFDRPGLHHDADYNDYQDNPRRFGFLTRAGLQLCRDIYHCTPGELGEQDWLTIQKHLHLLRVEAEVRDRRRGNA